MWDMPPILNVENDDPVAVEKQLDEKDEDNNDDLPANSQDRRRRKMRIVKEQQHHAFNEMFQHSH